MNMDRFEPIDLFISVYKLVSFILLPEEQETSQWTAVPDHYGHNVGTNEKSSLCTREFNHDDPPGWRHSEPGTLCKSWETLIQREIILSK